MPCTPIVMAQVYNSGAGQTAPFLVSIEEANSDSFKYHLINPSSTSKSAYTGSLQYTAICQ